MATILKINAEITANCKEIRFYETTGEYHATNNTEGWGAPNELTSDATDAYVTVLTPAGVAYTISLYSSFPTDDPNQYYTIDSSMIGYGTNQKLPDGVYRFTYHVITGTTTYTQVIEKLFYCNAKCCVFNMIAEIDYSCDCSESKIEKAKKAYLSLMGLEYAAVCGNKTLFEDRLEELEKLCKGNCSNC